MKLHLTLTTWLLALLFAASAAAAAQTAPAQTQIILQAWRVQSVMERGAPRENLQPLMTRVRPGEVIEYEARYVNGNAKAAQNVQLTLPVPAGGLQYLPTADSSTPVQTASLDGVRFDPVPLRRLVPRADGRRVMEDVPLAQYRYLRWSLGDLPAGAQRTVRARMQLPALAVASRS
ncbi:hypothetical protein ACG02S_13675 [Roseateles sp. DC23W]|uniref:Uncharacterized protein n=1 Tax=Pelomonas dachongensis TaxID=3299029 RepID=A0ABW7ENB2_9BURK